jgi:hypothetical protein
MRSASKLVRQAASADDIPFDDKVELLRKKFVDAPPHESTFDKEAVPFFSPHEVRTTIYKMNSQAATSIDGWTKDLFSQTIDAIPDIADLLAVFLNMILADNVGELFTKCLVHYQGADDQVHHQGTDDESADDHVHHKGANDQSANDHDCSEGQ